MEKINREQWDEMWKEIETSVMNWNKPDSRVNKHKGEIRFVDNDKIGEISWLHHYDTNYCGTKINSLGVYYSKPQEKIGEFLFFTPDKKWFREGSGWECNIGKKKIETLRTTVEKFLVKNEVLKEKEDFSPL